MQKTILVVEDDNELREMMEQFLTGRGYQVITCSDGWQGIQETIVKKPDLILMDINMPKLNGLNALDLIRVTRLTAHTPIIVMSAKTDNDTVLSAMTLGADDFVDKPFSYEKVANLINIQLFQIETPALREMLSNLTSPDAASLLGGCYVGAEYSNLDAYPLTHQSLELCILLPKGLKPLAAAKLSPEEMIDKVAVLAKATTNWRKVFPAPEAGQKKVA